MMFRLVHKGWDDELAAACRLDSSTIRIVCPFIQRKPIERLLKHGKPKTLQVITRFNLDDFYNRVSDMASLRLLLDNGAAIRGIKHLHAKMYLLGSCRAIVTSANLTDAALGRNHEFGFVAEDPAIVGACNEYFARLWDRGGHDVHRQQLEEWGNRIAKRLVASGTAWKGESLGDFGANAGLDPDPAVPAGWVAESGQAFVKLFGESTNRLSHDYPVIVEVERAGCHLRCTYPRDKRPRQVGEGALMFMGRLLLCVIS